MPSRNWGWARCSAASSAGSVAVASTSRGGASGSNETFIRLVAPGLAIFTFSSANLLELNGFVAAYFAGLLLGVRETAFRDRLREFGEADGTQFSLFVFLVFGVMMLPIAAPFWDWRAVVYALASLTLVRMLPSAISLIGAGLDRTTIAFIGWSGPRGIASVLYLSLVIDRFGFQGQERIFSVIVLTVLLSVLLHGATAAPSAALYGRHAAAAGRAGPAPSRSS